MGKVFFNLKKNNKGVSLVEVLVTVAMVVIMAGPLINSFLNARSVNSNARVIQNGTIVAQDTAEKFVALPLEQLLTVYSDKLDTDTMSTQPGVYIFENIEATGANGESFYVDVTLDANTYVEHNGSKIEVNNVKLPEMSSLYGSDAIMLYKYYTAEDENLKELFRGKLSDTTISALYTSEKINLSKETNILIRRSFNSAVGKYDYDISFNMHYYYKKGTGDEKQVTVTKSQEDIMLLPTQEHMMYLVCPIFDLHKYSDRQGDVIYASDLINIDFQDFCEGDYKNKNVYFYLAEQKAKNLSYGYTTKVQKLKASRIIVDGPDLATYDDSTTVFKFYTNACEDVTGGKGLTYTDKDSGVALYDMTVKVKHKDKIVAEFSATK